MEFNPIDLVKEYADCEDKMKEVLNGIKDIIIDCKSYLEGNSFYYHNTLNIFPELFPKQLNLFWCGRQANLKVCEIGFNAGHSTLLMLLGANTESLDFTIFDIGQHSYTKPCLKYMESQFPSVNFEYIEGDSTVTMPKWIGEREASVTGAYDVVHVDGGHTEHCIENDMKNADILTRVGGILIVDDTNIDYINECTNLYISSGKYKELGVLKTVGYEHRILRKLL